MTFLTIRQKTGFWGTLLVITGIFFAIASCKKETVTSGRLQPAPVTGTWKFILSPDKSVQDTTFIKGVRGSEQEEYAAGFENIYLYEDTAGNITGDLGPLRFEGSKKGDSVVLKVFNIKNGHFTPGTATSKMNHISTMRLKLDAFGFMNGHGTYLPNPDYEGAEKESYFVLAQRRNPLTATAARLKKANSNVFHTLCEIYSSISSTLISYLSDGAFRPMGNCYLEKDGGGYYIYGRYGPGSLLPLNTQTFYYPYEWSWCKVRKYDFAIDLRGEIRAVEALKWIIQHQPPTPHFYHDLGFSSFSTLNTAIEDFHNKFGGFAISLGYSLRTRNLSIYVNHSKGNDQAALAHSLIRSIGTALNPFVGKIYYYSGRNISDHWYLRRSELGACNSSLLFVYLLGTSEVEYN